MTQIPSILTHTTNCINFNYYGKFDNKKLDIWVKNLGAGVDGPKYLPKYFGIWYNTKKLENI